ncbi:MAG: hypothetical protein ACW99Q_18090 [Candidatus Kariarchaeaceae archaeon]|jgi:hypothetical protein
MLLTFFLCFIFWSGKSLSRSSGESSILWQAPSKYVIAYISFILSLLSVLIPDSYQPTILASESARYYFPVSYPMGVRFFTSQNMKMSNWRVWFLTPEFNWTFSLSGYIPFQTNFVNFLISCGFLFVNYFFTLSLLKYLYSHKQR